MANSLPDQALGRRVTEREAIEIRLEPRALEFIMKADQPTSLTARQMERSILHVAERFKRCAALVVVQFGLYHYRGAVVVPPKSDVLTGKWNPPPITKLQGASNLMAQ